VLTQFASNTDLRGLNLVDGQYTKLVLPGALLDGVELFRTVLQEADLSNASVRGVHAVRAICVSANFRGADLTDGNWAHADLSYADLRDADLRGCNLSPQTNLKGAQVSGMRIDLQSLRMLGAQRGGLTEGDLATLEISDDQTKLTASFGGFWTTLHVLAFTLFLLPYVIFCIHRYIASWLTNCQVHECVPLRQALGHYIVTGGAGDEIDWLALILFFLLLAYNAFRISLVYKARALGLNERASGIRRNFHLAGYWRWAYEGVHILIWINLTLAMVHIYHFLAIPVPQ
jgi:hypothetical protein